MTKSEIDELVLYLESKKYSEWIRHANAEPDLSKRGFDKGYSAAIWHIFYWTKKKPKQTEIFK